MAINRFDVSLSTNQVQFLQEFQVIYTLHGGAKPLEIITTNYDFAKTSVSIKGVEFAGDTIALRLQSFETSNFTLPAFSVKIVENGTTNNVKTPEIIIGQKSISAAISNKAPIEDIFPVGDYLPWIIMALAIIVAAAGTLLAMHYWKAKKKGPLTAASAAEPQIDPYLEAAQALEQVKREEYPDGNTYPAFIRIWEVQRRFIDRVFKINALELSTSEINSYFKKASQAKPELSELSQTALHVLKVCDRVKYAKHPAEQKQKDDIIQESIEFIEKTKEVMTIQPAPSENKEAVK